MKLIDRLGIASIIAGVLGLLLTLFRALEAVRGKVWQVDEPLEPFALLAGDAQYALGTIVSGATLLLIHRLVRALETPDPDDADPADATSTQGPTAP